MGAVTEKEGGSLPAANANYKPMLEDATATDEVGPRTDILDKCNHALEAFRHLRRK